VTPRGPDGARLGAAGRAAQRTGQRRQQHEHQHHGQVFDHQPADRDAPGVGIEQPQAFQRPQQHHRAGHRQRQTEHQRGAQRPVPPERQRAAHERGDGDLDQGAGHGDLAHRQQVVEREMQAHAEHQQHHPDLGQLGRDLRVGHEAGRERPDDHARQQIPHQGRQPDPCSEKAEHEREPEPGGDGVDQ
jgi:hypothetical protein